MVRDVSAELFSNPLSVPILADQDRGFRQGYLSADLSGQLGRHQLKGGVDAMISSLRERFSYRITRPEQFDDDVPPQFRFAGRKTGFEYAAYAQDSFRAGDFTLSAGLRWDSYRLLISERAWSPRLGIAWHWRAANLVLRASYDRAFQTPAIENLLLSSSTEARSLGEEAADIPVPASRGNFYQFGISKAVHDFVRLDLNWFRRTIRNFGDDDVLLNTGISFPIAFHRAHIQGLEAKLELPGWRWLSGSMSYSHLVGTGFLPITGGLLLEEDALEQMSSSRHFPISQDQRNTFRARLRVQPLERLWWNLGWSYNSGLPFEIEDEPDVETWREQYGDRILGELDLKRGRVRPSLSLDVGAGAILWRRSLHSLSISAITNRLNLINFAGVLSGTAFSVPRSLAVRAHWQF
jgi:hypothetical protein